MKLGLVTHFMPPHHGGIERIAEDHAVAAAAAGMAVVWIASHEPASTLHEQTLPWGRAVRVPCWNPFERRTGVPYPIWLPSARQIVDREVGQCDVVHVHDVLYPGTTLALRSAAQKRIPTLLTQHVGFVPYRSLVLETIQRLAYRTIGRRNVARATAVGYYNSGVRLWLETACGLNRPAIHLPNGVDIDRFRPAADSEESRAIRQRLGLPIDKPIVLFVGRLVPKKGAHIVAEAAPPDCHVLLVGERGDLDLRLLPTRASIELRPFVERELLADIMRAADIFVLPSGGEGFPLVAQEAMASGLPVILGDDAGYRDQVDPDSAVFVEPSVAMVRATLERLLESTEARANLGQRARACVIARWGQATCRAQLISLYRSLSESTR